MLHPLDFGAARQESERDRRDLCDAIERTEAMSRYILATLFALAIYGITAFMTALTSMTLA
jgi:hypothetical protein